jgi:3',5'-cyclic AMP phosphodiesterase CpdA
VLKIVHISDLHLALPYGVHRAILDISQLLQNVPGGSWITKRYTYAYEPAQDELPNALRGCLIGNEALLAITGDIAAAPYDNPNDIANEYYRYVSELRSAADGAKLLPILGNHDFPFTSPTPFKKTDFDRVHQITVLPRYEYFRGSTTTLIFFLLNSTDAILPATGEVPGPTLAWLKDAFTQGHQRGLTFQDGMQFDPKEYDFALKIGVLHHFPLPRSAYGVRLGLFEYLLNRLINWPNVIDTCKGEIDLLLFGHSHVPVLTVIEGMIAVDAGSTLACDSANSPVDAQFQLIQIHDQRTIEVISHRWDDGKPRMFVPVSPVRFERKPIGEWVTVRP